MGQLRFIDAGKGSLRTDVELLVDQYVRLRITLPDQIDGELEELAKRWREHFDFDPRKDMRRQT